MNKFLLVLALSLSGAAFAESVDIKDVKSEESTDGSTTTIEIKKGKPGQVKTDNQWELTKER
jgi:hypothetical protein